MAQFSRCEGDHCGNEPQRRTMKLMRDSPSIFGLTAQALTFAFATPLYCAVQVHTSVTAGKPSAQNLRIPNSVLRVLPFAFVLGMLVPSSLMLLPVSETITPDVKQILIAIWQPWPAYVAILLRFAHTALPPTGQEEDSPQSTAKGRRSLRYAYAFAFANTAIPHIVTLTVSLATVAAPAIFDPKYREALHPLNVFHTPLPWTSPVVQVTTVGEGVHGFLRWDYLIGTAGVLVWAISLYRTAHRFVYGRPRLLRQQSDLKWCKAGDSLHRRSCGGGERPSRRLPESLWVH